MSEPLPEPRKRNNVSAYSQLSSIINELKNEKISLSDAMNKIQLKETAPSRPYCKVTSSGSLALYGVTKLPIVLYPEQWQKLLKVTKSNYIENYIKHNEDRLKFKPKNNYQRFNNKSSLFSEDSNSNKFEDSVIDESTVEQI